MLDPSVGLGVVIVCLQNRLVDNMLCLPWSCCGPSVSIPVYLISSCGSYSVFHKSFHVFIKFAVWTQIYLYLFGQGLDIFQLNIFFLFILQYNRILFKILKLWKETLFIIPSLQNTLSQLLVHIFLCFPLGILNIVILQTQDPYNSLGAFFQLPCESFLIGPNFWNSSRLNIQIP